MDMDTNHKNLNIQNQIKSATKILRCYHSDSKAFDMLQLTDLLLQCAIKAETWEYDRHKYNKLTGKLEKEHILRKKDLKNLLISHAIRRNNSVRKIRKKIL